MQISGTFPGLSDGTKKTVVGATPPARRPAAAAPARPAPKPAATPHRAGGHARHTRRGK